MVDFQKGKGGGLVPCRQIRNNLTTLGIIFRHIVNIQRIRDYNSINLKNGYPILEIRSPKEIIDYEK
jgi:hypothetical protein